MTSRAGPPDIRDIERRLVVVLKKERRSAMGFTVLTVLCTPFIVAAISLLISLPVMIMVGFVYEFSPRFAIDTRAFYGCWILFLAITAAFVLRSSRSGDEPPGLAVTWLAGVVVLLVLIYLTFATALFRTRPYTFAIIYCAVGFLALALFGRVYMKTPVTQDVEIGDYRSLPLALVGFIAMAYGEIASSSWLWFPPDEDEVRVAAWILHKLAVDEGGCLEVQSTNRRILGLLVRLKYVRIRNGKLRLTYRGHDLVKSAGKKDALE